MPQLPIAKLPESEQQGLFSKICSFVTHLVIATIGAMFCGWILPLLIVLRMRGHLNGTVVEKVAALFDGPYFVFPILCGFVLGWISHRFLKSNTAAWTWVPMALVLMWNLLTWQSYGPDDAVANFFTSQCGGSECLYELSVTAPFYTSVAYSCGWILQRTFRKWSGNATRNLDS